MSAALYAAFAIATALHVLSRDELVQSIEVTLFDVGINAPTTCMPMHFAGGAPKWLGNGHGIAVPWNAYPTADGWLLICSTNDGHWRRLAALIDPGLPADEHYAALRSRLGRRGEVDAMVSRWTRELSLDAVVGRLQGEAIPCGKIVSLDDLDREPNLVLRDSVKHLYDTVRGRRVRVPSELIRFDGGAPTHLSIRALEAVNAASAEWLVPAPRIANRATRAPRPRPPRRHSRACGSSRSAS